MFAVAYIILLGLWMIGSGVGVAWSGIFAGLAIVLVPVHIAVRFIEASTGKPFVQRRSFAIAWGGVLAVIVISLVAAAATAQSAPFASDTAAGVGGLALIFAAPVIAVFHLRAIRVDRKRLADGPAS
jgi:hypothetical protein